MEGLALGLRADEVVMRWQADAVAALERDLAPLRDHIAGEAFDRVSAAAAGFQAREQEIAARASASQLQADQRDAIAQSMADALQDLGFMVSPPAMEHADQPGSAVIFHARSDTGRAIGISVPVEGEVWYQVRGYAMEARSRVGGGTAATCDEAQAALEGLHDILRDKYGVATNGLRWEGHDPDRKLRQADALPRSDGGVRQGGR